MHIQLLSISTIKPICKANLWGGISINGKISLFFIENMNSELYINILKENLPEMKRIIYIIILARDNEPAHVSETKQQLKKED